eukprot:Hpha_TRINITY_DN15109_c2_g3::TRINITY_DN15109_c2_g3_i1::g.130227::m.130227
MEQIEQAVERRWLTEEDVWLEDEEDADTDMACDEEEDEDPPSDGFHKFSAGFEPVPCSGDGCPLLVPRRQGTTGGWDRLGPLQRDGVRWMWDQVRRRARGEPAGGLVCDDAALGTAAQVLCTVDAALRGGHEELVLIATETKGLQRWWQEAGNRTPLLPISKLTKEDPAGVRREIVENVAQRKPAVLLCTHHILRSCEALREVDWGVVILDDADWLRKPCSETARAAHAIRSRLRFAVTSAPTARQDLWDLMRFVSPDIIRCSPEEFKSAERRIKAGLRHSVQDPRYAEAERLEASLREVCTPFILRRGAPGAQTGGSDGSESSMQRGGSGGSPALRDMCVNTPPPAGEGRSSSDMMDSICRRVSSMRMSVDKSDCSPPLPAGYATPRGAWVTHTPSQVPIVQTPSGGWTSMSSNSGGCPLPTPPAPSKAAAPSPGPSQAQPLGRPPLHLGRSTSVSMSLDRGRHEARRLFGSGGSSSGTTALQPAAAADVVGFLDTPSPDHHQAAPTPQAPRRCRKSEQWVSGSSTGMSPGVTCALTFATQSSVPQCGRSTTGSSGRNSLRTAPVSSPMATDVTPRPLDPFRAFQFLPNPLTPGHTPSPPAF